MRLYSSLAAWKRPKTFTGKILFISFVGVHVPLLMLVGYLLIASPLSILEVTPILVVVLAATLLGTAGTLWAVYALLAPIRKASAAIRIYLAEKTVSALPMSYSDEAGRLMADVQEGITRLDGALDAAYASRDAAVRERQAKFGLLSKMSHELRTPLNHILGFSEILQHEMLGPLGQSSYKGYATDINASGTSLLGLVQSVLDLSQLEAGDYELAPDTVDLAPLVEGTIALQHFHAEQAGITLDNRVPTHAPPPPVSADGRALKQMLLGMLTASVQSTANGGTVRIDTAVEGPWVKVSVTDDGRALTRDDVPEIIDSAVTGVVPANAERTGGEIASTSPIGLGLAVVYSLAKLHGGKLQIANGSGAGKTIDLLLPLAASAAEPMRAAA